MQIEASDIYEYATQGKRVILYRLIKDGVIVGYEWHLRQDVHGIRIFHCDPEFENADVLSIFNNNKFMVPHDRKDLFTGRISEGVKLYENDIVELYEDVSVDVQDYMGRGKIEWLEQISGWYVEGKGKANDGLADILETYYMKVIGIEEIKKQARRGA